MSSHATEREAVESAVNRELAKPADVVEYRHDYVVRVSVATTTAISAAVVGVTMVSSTGQPVNVVASPVTGVSTVVVRGDFFSGKPLGGQTITMNAE